MGLRLYLNSVFKTTVERQILSWEAPTLTPLIMTELIRQSVSGGV